jgi:hypothetical protein
MGGGKQLVVVLLACSAALSVASLYLHDVGPDTPADDEVLIRVIRDGTIELWHGPRRRSRERLPFRLSRWDDVESLRDG